jgi:hypothetical protein
MPVYRRDIYRPGLIIDFHATAYKQSCKEYRQDRIRQEMHQQFQRELSRGCSHSEADRRKMMEAIAGVVSILFISMAAGGITIYFGGVGKGVCVYGATVVTLVTAGCIAFCTRD